jgi:gas vesicle protein
MFVFGLIVGVLIGAAILFVTQRSQLRTLETKLRQTRRELDTIEADFQSQMKQTINYLRQQYDRESTQKNEETVQQYQKEIRNLKHEHHLHIEKLQAKISSSQASIDPNPIDSRPFTQIESHLEEETEFPFDAFSDSFLDLERPLEKTGREIPLAAPVQGVPIKDFLAEESPPNPDDLDLGVSFTEPDESFLDELASFIKERPQIAFDDSAEATGSSSNESPSLLSQPLENIPPSSPPQSETKFQQKENTLDRVLSLRTVDRLPQLGEYIYDRDPQIRAAVAQTMGDIAESANIRPKIGQCLPILEKLIRDNDVSVRRATVSALSKIKSEKVIPLIRLALKDNDSEVVRLASNAIGRFRVYPNSDRSTKKPNSTKKLKG